MYLIEDLFSDFDGTLFPGNIAFSQFEILDKQYVGVLKDVRSVVRNHEETPENRWEDLVENLVKVVGKYEIQYDDSWQAAKEIVECAEVSHDLEKALNSINPKHMTVFTGSEDKVVDMYVKKVIQSVIPETCIRDCLGTKMEIIDGVITGKIDEIWDSQKRASMIEELKSNGKTVVIGNSENDEGMMEKADLSFYITKQNTGIKGNIVYTNLGGIPYYMENLI